MTGTTTPLQIAALLGQQFDIRFLSQICEMPLASLQENLLQENAVFLSQDFIYIFEEHKRQALLQNFTQKQFWVDKIFSLQQKRILALENHIQNIHQQMHRNTEILLAASKRDSVRNGLWEDTLNFVTESLSQVIDVNRVSIWEYDGEKITCIDLYEKAHQRHSKGTVLWAKDFPDYFAAVATEKVIVASQVHTNTATACFSEIYFKPLQIESLLDVPIFFDGKLSAIVCFEHQFGQREWNAEEISFAVSMTANITLTYRSMQLQKLSQQLKLTNEELQVQNEELSQQQEEILAQRDFIDERNRQLKKSNEAMQRKEEILIKAYEQIKQSQEKINLQNRQIEDSIRAALTIQKSILPPQQRMKEALGEHFVFFKPKDIVSGDFYWVTKHQQSVILACVDCSGHGVPGAFMTLIGSTLLDKIVRYKNIDQPAQILSELHSDVVRLLRQTEIKNESTMDAAVLLFRRQDHDFEAIYAGAKRPLYAVQKGQLKKWQGVRKSVGSLRNSFEFSQEKLTLYQGDMIYLCSDGFADQSNPYRESFGSRRLQQLFLDIAHLPLEQQEMITEKTFEKFANGEAQRDDLIVVGVKVE